MAQTWRAYYSHVKHRLTFDRSFFKSAAVVAKLYLHYKHGDGKRHFLKTHRRNTIAFYPQPVGPWYNIWLVVQNTNLKIIKNPRKADYLFIFDDSTHSDVASKITKRITAPVINGRITDISKKNVSRIFEDVFGYGLEIDPTTFEGKAVEKSDENGVHDGRIINCPIDEDAVRKDCCYQKFIDSSFTDDTCEDLRVASVFGKIATVFHKHKTFENRFSTTYQSTTVREAEAVFSSIEEDNITQFCDEIGLDFGAIDVMRDKHDMRIYIVDVNKTCMPVLSLPMEDQHRSLAQIARVFENNLPPK